jgi:hypothetical protein
MRKQKQPALQRMNPLQIALAGFLATLPVVQAQTVNLYRQDWAWSGSNATSLVAYGWYHALPPSGFIGNYEEAGAADANSNESLPPTAVFIGAEKAGTGFFYTTNSAGAAKLGDAAFRSIDPTIYSNLTFSIQTQHSWQGTNLASYFAVETGGRWYVATNHPMATYAQDSASGSFEKASLVYNPSARNWTGLTLNATNQVLLGAPAPNDLSGRITGVGVFVRMAGGGSWDFNNFLVTDTHVPVSGQTK